MLTEQDEENANSAALREQLRHVYWIGGGSCAGKSTVARRIAAQHGLRIYATDEVMADHASRSTREDAPLLHRFIGMDTDERWANRSPKTLLETFHWFEGEVFNLIIEDLLSLPRESGVIVEGFRLLPRLVKPALRTSSCCLASSDSRLPPESDRESWRFVVWISRQDHRSGKSAELA
jgi:2-phosphoglycerate kinase